MGSPSVRFVALVCLCAAAWVVPANAQTELFRSGSLTWDTSIANPSWGVVTGGPYNVTNWDNAQELRAVFEGTAGTATLGGAITAHSLRFSVNNWIVTGNTLTLAGVNPGAGTVEVGSGNTATVNSVLAGSVGLTKTGAGTLTLGGTNTFTGPITVTGGVVSIAATAALNSSGTGAVTLDGGTLRNTNPGNAGSFISATHDLVIGANGGTVDYTSSGTGTVSIYSGTIKGTGTLTKVGPGEFRYQGSGTANSTYTKLVVNEGLFRVGGTAGSAETAFGAAPASPLADAITLNGGSIGASLNITLNANRGITLGANGGSINTSAGAIVVPGVVSGAGTLSKTVAGTLTLSGANTYSGGTVVSSGTLIVSNATGSGTGSGAVTVGGSTLTNNGSISGAVTVNSGGTLNGTGTHTGAVTINGGGTIRGATGTATGNLNFTNAVTVNGAAGTGGGVLATQLATSGGNISANSQLALTGAAGNLNLDPTAGKFRVTLLNDSGLTNGQAYTITLATAAGAANFQRAGSGTDSFTTADFDVVSGSGFWAAFQSVSLDRSGTNLQLTFTPVPEPTTVLAIAGVGLGVVRLVRRRTRVTTA